MSDIVSAASQLILLGTDDQSRRAMPRSVALRPTHLPFTPFFAQRGKRGPRMMTNGDQSLYGSATFDPLSPYYNMMTPYITGFLGRGNAVMAERLIPDDAGPEASARISLELIQIKEKDFERNSDGSIKLVSGQPVEQGTAMVKHKARIVVEQIPDNDITGFGKGQVTPGTWKFTDPDDPLATEVTSEIIPLFDVRESSIGSDGNLTAFNIFSPTSTTTEVPANARFLTSMKAFPVVMRVGRRSSASATPKVQPNMSGSYSVQGVLKYPGVDPVTKKSQHLSRTFTKAYNRSNDTRLPDVIGYIDGLAVYQSNIDRIQGLIYETEKAFASANPGLEMYYDFSDSGEDERFVMNLLGGVTFKDYPYHTYRIEASDNGYRPTPNQWISLSGGSDGTMTTQTYAKLVTDVITEYGNRFNPRQDDARRVESIFYDPGLPMDDKLKLFSFLAIRKDLALVVGTHVEGDGMIDANEEYERAAVLRAYAELHPESVHFGTGVSRVAIVGRSGELVDSAYEKRVSGVYEWAMKSADFMGAGNRVWRQSKRPGGYPNSIITELTNINVTWTPVDQRIKDWDVGLNWIQAFDQNSFHFPAYKSVYGDDTSVLTSWFANMAIVEINKVCQNVHRRTSGTDHLTNAQLAERVDGEIARQLMSVFGSAYRLEVETIFTDEDIDRNFSWTTYVRLGVPGQKTVMTAAVQAYRKEDLENR